MPYKVVRTSRKSRPYNIVNTEKKVVVGTSTSLAKAKRSIGYRLSGKSEKNIKTYKRKVDNKMRAFGETDLQKKTIRINKSKKKNTKGDILDTIVHEKQHILHPKAKEKTIRKRTTHVIKHMDKPTKQKHYNLFSGRR